MDYYKQSYGVHEQGGHRRLIPIIAKVLKYLTPL